MDDEQGGGELHEVELEDLLFYERCGGGTFGSVYRALWRSQNMIVAVKRLLVLEKEVKCVCVTVYVCVYVCVHLHMHACVCVCVCCLCE